jgi:hypothetical protein
LNKPELEFHVPDGEWRVPAGSRSDGLHEKRLSADADGTAYTRILRFAPGATSEPDGTQVHDFWEEVFIVEGDITDVRLGERFTAGMYACRPPGMEHGPWRSETGALMVEFRYGIPEQQS